MNSRNYIYLLFLSITLLQGCAYDNYDKPSSVLEGQVVYNNQPVYVSGSEVELELWQPGYAVEEKIPVYLAPDGSFQAKLFDGTYKLTQLVGSGPWVPNTDTVVIELNGHARVEFPVEPYYIINNPSITNNGGLIEATFSVKQINSSRDVELMGLYLSTTTLVSKINNLDGVEQAIDSTDLGSPFNLSITPTGELIEEDYIFARIGVKTSGVKDLIYSKIFKIKIMIKTLFFYLKL